MMNEQERHDPLSGVSDLASTSIGILRTAKDIVLGGLDGGVLVGFALVAVILVVFVASVAAINPSTLFSKRESKVKYIVKSLEGGFNRRKSEERVRIANYINGTYNCEGDLSNMSGLVNGGYTFSSWACEITVTFVPDLEDYAYRIDARAVAVNSTLELLDSQYDAEGGFQELDSALFDMDDEGNMVTTDYGEEYLGSYDSEYIDHQSSAYFRSLRRDAYSLFKVEMDTGEWVPTGFYTGTKQKPVTTCYNKERQPDMTYTLVPVACDLPHVEEKEGFEEVEATFGNINIPIKCKETNYKKEELDSLKGNLVGQQLHLENDQGEVEKKTVRSSHEADELTEEIIAYYIEQYAYSLPFEAVLVDGFFNPHVLEGNIALLCSTLGLSSFDEMIAEIRDLQRKGLILGDGTGTLQCTEFVSYVTYKLYGNNRYPGSDGIRAASLLQGQGWTGDFDAIGRGTVLSRPAYDGTVHGHTMIVLGREDNTLIIADANRDHQGGISIYSVDVDTLNASVGGRLTAATPPGGSLSDDGSLTGSITDGN